MEWERIDSYHERAKVPGGWIFKAYADVCHLNPDYIHTTGYDFRVSVCFVPDPNHEWQLDKETE